MTRTTGTPRSCSSSAGSRDGRSSSRPRSPTLADSPVLTRPNRAYLAAAAALAAEAGDEDGARVALAGVAPFDEPPHGLAPSSVWMGTMFAVVEAYDRLDAGSEAGLAYEALLPFAHLPMMSSFAVTCAGSDPPGARGVRPHDGRPGPGDPPPRTGRRGQPPVREPSDARDDPRRSGRRPVDPGGSRRRDRGRRPLRAGALGRRPARHDGLGRALAGRPPWNRGATGVSRAASCATARCGRCGPARSGRSWPTRSAWPMLATLLSSPSQDISVGRAHRGPWEGSRTSRSSTSRPAGGAPPDARGAPGRHRRRRRRRRHRAGRRRLRAELDQLVDELTRTTRLGGRSRSFASCFRAGEDLGAEGDPAGPRPHRRAGPRAGRGASPPRSARAPGAGSSRSRRAPNVANEGRRRLIRVAAGPVGITSSSPRPSHLKNVSTPPPPPTQLSEPLLPSMMFGPASPVRVSLPLPPPRSSTSDRSIGALGRSPFPAARSDGDRHGRRRTSSPVSRPSPPQTVVVAAGGGDVRRRRPSPAQDVAALVAGQPVGAVGAR